MALVQAAIRLLLLAVCFTSCFGLCLGSGVGATRSPTSLPSPRYLRSHQPLSSSTNNRTANNMQGKFREANALVSFASIVSGCPHGGCFDCGCVDAASTPWRRSSASTKSLPPHSTPYARQYLEGDVAATQGYAKLLRKATHGLDEQQQSSTSSELPEVRVPRDRIHAMFLLRSS
jgi:hypothetical protein